MIVNAIGFVKGAAAEIGREALSEDMAAETRCKEAFSAVKQFEDSHRLNYQVA